MRLFKVLEHEGNIFRHGDKVKAVLDNGREIEGKIKWYGEYNMDGRVENSVKIGGYCVFLFDIKQISKV